MGHPPGSRTPLPPARAGGKDRLRVGLTGQCRRRHWTTAPMVKQGRPCGQRCSRLALADPSRYRSGAPDVLRRCCVDPFCTSGRASHLTASSAVSMALHETARTRDAGSRGGCEI